MYRGHFTLVTTRPMPEFAQVGSQPRVVGRACFGVGAWFGGDDAVIEAAVEDAISKGADANALFLAKIQDTGRCVEAEGWPVRHD